MKNERYPPNNPTETRTIPARTQTAKPYSELAIIDLHRIQESYIGINRGSQNAPPQRIPRVDEVESRGWGRRAPQSPSSSSFGAPARSNKIYKSDEVFLIEENKTSDPSQTQFPYKKHRKSADCKSNKPYRKYSQSRAGRYCVPATREYSRLQVKNIRRGTRPAGGSICKIAHPCSRC